MLSFPSTDRSEQLESMILSFDEVKGERRTLLPADTKYSLTWQESSPFLEDLTPPKMGGALLVRHLYDALGFDPYRILRYRLEHKLVQASLLERYCHGCLPTTYSLSSIYSANPSLSFAELLCSIENAGFLIKRALGDFSGEEGSFDQLPSLRNLTLSNIGLAVGTSLSAEAYIVQRRLAIASEYRVHSLEDIVIASLSFRRYGAEAASKAELVLVNDYVQSILDQLPVALVRDSLYGWDVAVTSDGLPQIVEVNSTGFHTAFRPGFQTSGFFQVPSTGIYALVGLLAHIRQHYSVRISVTGAPDAMGPLALTYFLIALFERILTGPGNGESEKEEPLRLKHYAHHSPELGALIWLARLSVERP